MSYKHSFMGNMDVTIPKVSSEEVKKFEINGLDLIKYYLDYSNYSVFQNPFRKFPYFTACNIDGNLFKKITRNKLFSGKGDKWSKDSRIPKEHQLGHELYKAEKSDFDKGHLTKREDVQWGKKLEDAMKSAESTFFFTNAMPQMGRLNRGIWRKIEDYILHREVVENEFKISLFTGPIFQEEDPDFVTEINGEVIKIPYLFWKLVYYLSDGTLYRTAFLTSQIGLLRKKRIVKPLIRGEADVIKKDPFLNFKDAETYQVKVDLIEKLTNMKFMDALEVFEDERPERLILKDVNVRNDRTGKMIFSISNIKL